MDPKVLKAKRQLFEGLIRQGVLLSQGVKAAFLRVQREAFLPDKVRNQAYSDMPLPIGYRQTISAPHMCIMMLEALELTPGLKVLEVGTGSGYHAALSAEMIAPHTDPLPSQLQVLLPSKPVHTIYDVTDISLGHVYTIERIPELSLMAEKRLQEQGYGTTTTVIRGDGTLGYDKNAPYDRILVTGAPPTVPPSLIQQLDVGGIMVIPVGRLAIHQTLVRVRKSPTGHITRENLCGVAFVPLIGKQGWQNS